MRDREREIGWERKRYREGERERGERWGGRGRDTEREREGGERW